MRRLTLLLHACLLDLGWLLNLVGPMLLGRQYGDKTSESCCGFLWGQNRKKMMLVVVKKQWEMSGRAFVGAALRRSAMQGKHEEEIE